MDAPELAFPQRLRLERFKCAQSVDLHCHCLPGVDDGPGDLEEALALCRALVRDGFTKVVATPHQLGRWDGENFPEDVRKGVTELQGHLDAHKIPLKVLPGGEVRVDERIPKLLQADRISTLGDSKKYLLLELPSTLAMDPDLLMQHLFSTGLRIVLAHCERYEFLFRNIASVEEWIEKGTILQVNAGSLVGAFGAGSQNAAWEWIRRGWISVVATDAHSLGTRRPRMTEAIDLIAQQCGEEAAGRMCVINPSKLIEGEPLT
ncbi:MAG TPA: CpsB/CapC family capsule biosynthesis tyrosine phosphatase [Tepidisphaeraceae bacterium]|jgi:protein-tyrosine phosphatase|nr:CpsB/CapC family capsule biosynthesis tyrosine phosphatase [Tepidisphaeraceae bacterium]